MTQTPDRTEAVFAAAIVLETLEERAAYLDQACAGDPPSVNASRPGCELTTGW
jgi:hypothetical protein